MVELVGSLQSTVVKDDNQIQIFAIPALTEQGAMQKTRLNIRTKGIDGADITRVEKAESAGLPGWSVYEVKVVSPR